MRGPTERRQFHFDLSHVAGVNPRAEFTLHARGRTHVLTSHGSDTRHAARRTHAALARVPDERLTHYSEEIDLPSTAPMLGWVTTPSPVAGHRLGSLATCFIHIPRAAQARAAAARSARVDARPQPARLLGAEPPIDVHDYKSALDAACALIFHHPELCNLNPDTAAAVMEHIKYANGISDLADSIYHQARAHHTDPTKDNWVVEKPWIEWDGSTSADSQYVWSNLTQSWMVGPLKAVLRSTKDDPDLETTDARPGCWSVQPGVPSAPVQSGAVRHGLLGADAGAAFALKDLTPNWGFAPDGSPRVTARADGGVRFEQDFKNWWFFWRSLYVEFRGPAGEAIEPVSWSSSANDHGTKKYLNLIADRPTILGIPLPPPAQTIGFTWPANASSAHFLAGGLGRREGDRGEDGVYYGAWDADVCTLGTILTAVMNIGLPSIGLALGIAFPPNALTPFARTAMLLGIRVIPVMIRAGLRLTVVGLKDVDAWAKLASPIFVGGLTKMYKSCCVSAQVEPDVQVDEVMAQEAAEGAAQKAVPFFGWVAWGMSLAADTAALTESTVSIALAPAAFEIAVSRTMDIAWTLAPDVNHQNTWPREAVRYEVHVVYTDGAAARPLESFMDPSPQYGPIVARLSQVPTGGTVKLKASFYSASGWLCGYAETKEIDALPTRGNTLEVGPTNIEERLIPLTASTQYQISNLLAFDSASGKLQWAPAGSPPAGTRRNLDSGNTGRNLSELTGITLSQQTSQIGYAWQASGQGVPIDDQSAPYAGQMYGLQVVDNRQADRSSASPRGFSATPLLVFDRTGPGDGSGLNFFLDPSSRHLRRLTLAPGVTPFTAPGKSWGRFNQKLDAATIASGALVAGVNTVNAKLEVLKVPRAATADADAPLADIFSGYGSREGLLHQPVGIAAATDGALLILEGPDETLKAPARVQALDTRGNPVRRFAGATSSFAIRTESQPLTCLDLSIDPQNFVFVLKYIGDGGDVADYFLDIYNADGTFLSQTKGIAAAKMCVDIWRAMFTLHYDMVQGAGRTEPAVGIWLPSTP
jgi:hypothetical protein